MLARQASVIAQGRLDSELELPHSGDEIGRLSRSFNDMRLSLREYIDNLREATAARERIESELSIARDIQMSFLPDPDARPTGYGHWEIGARIELARETGGDLYDHFLLDERRLFMIIGDVSGKGMPAALFMAVTRTVFKMAARPGISPSDILAAVNRELCRDNASSMFVSVWCAVLDTLTGELSYSNAGHNPPYIMRRDGDAARLPLPPGTVLGANDEARYETRQVVMADGDLLAAYTDGVTEAMSEAGGMFGEERFAQAMMRVKGLSAREAADALLGAVHGFAAGAEQYDDITILCLAKKRVSYEQSALIKNT
jgi:sigma-B regulation protein RsbU (phosphoserine phosphatase)